MLKAAACLPLLYPRSALAAAPPAKRVRQLPDKTDSVLNVAWSANGKKIAAGGLHEEIWVWNAETGKIEKIFEPKCSDIHMLTFSPDGKWLAVGGSRATRLYELPSPKSNDAALDGFTGSVPLIAFSHDGKRIAAADEDGKLQVFDSLGLHPVEASEQGGSGALAWSPDNSQIVIGDITKLRVFEAGTGKLIWRLDETPNTVKSAVWSANGKLIAYGCANNNIYLVDSKDGKLIRKFEGHTDGVHSLAFTPNDAGLLSGSADKTIGVWEVATGKNTAFAQVCEQAVTSVAFSPDGKQCAVGGYTDFITIFEVPQSGITAR